MIRTKDLEEFIGAWLVVRNPLQGEYKLEIVARLKAFDKLKESIEKLLAQTSNT